MRNEIRSHAITDPVRVSVIPDSGLQYFILFTAHQKLEELYDILKETTFIKLKLIRGYC